MTDFRQFINGLVWIVLGGKGILLPLLLVDRPRGYLLSPLHLDYYYDKNNRVDLSVKISSK